MSIATRRRARVRVDGTVQGVGFRPFVYRLAHELDLGGWVRNDERGVVLEVEGEASAVEAFVRRLRDDAPPLARITAVHVRPAAPTGERGFAISSSERTGRADAPVAADAATCDACLAELWDPADRRHRYPFVNCTDCGPRFTIVRDVPYDRANTTMAGFALCDACRAEYEDPGDRRFHAEPNACPVCGPRTALLRPDGSTVDADDAVAAAATAVLDGAIVAVKGLGGYHLTCRADREAVVAALRARKHREHKPFAVLARDLAAARGLVALTPDDEVRLCAADRPIVLASRRAGAPVAAAVAPACAELGVMLPYSALHHLLAADAGVPLVATSGNRSDEPIAYRDADALERLGAIADLLLVHDRPIHTRTDDSVIRGEVVVRRSRGRVPTALALPGGGGPVLGCGAELKNTFCLGRHGRAWVSHHIGDLTNAETLESFVEGVDYFERLFAVTPQVVAHDLHPDYLSTSYALARDGVEHVAVQHHHAHLAACLAEHGHAGPAVGAIYDGTGLGTDGTSWGGELLVGDLAGSARAGHLRTVPQPGGDRAARQPWRMACAWLQAVSGVEPPPLAGIDVERWSRVAALARSTLAPSTTSIGRLFDAVAALCGVCTVNHYEGQAAAELEAVARHGDHGAYPIAFDGRVLDPAPALDGAVRDLARGAGAAVVAARFHDGLAEGTARACAALAEAHGLDTVVLSGGVFVNRRLRERTAQRLRADHLTVLVPRVLPPGDGGIAYGQAAVAGARTSA